MQLQTRDSKKGRKKQYFIKISEKIRFFLHVPKICCTFTRFPCLGKYKFLLKYQIYASIICIFQKFVVPLRLECSLMLC